LERGESNKAKRKAYRQNIKKKYLKPHGHPRTLRTHLHAKHLCLKPLIKIKKMKEAKPKGTPRIPMPPKGQQNSTKRMNLRGEPDKTQAKHEFDKQPHNS
jgi:hypothetical protein